VQYDSSKYTIWTWKNPIQLYSRLNPLLVFNELIFGKRVPKILLLEKYPSKSTPKKNLVPCPHCGTMHPSSKWSNRNNAYKNWFGLYCDQCGKIIPCPWNFTSILLLGITFPIWIWFVKSWKAKWLKQQPTRYLNLKLDESSNPYDGLGWLTFGLFWGISMYFFSVFLFPYFSGEAIQIKKVLVGIPMWLICGLGMGYAMKMVYAQKAN